MKRVHAFEFEDQSWCPAVLRDAMTGYISTVMRKTDMLAPLMPKVIDAARATGVERVIDLCSGGGFPAARMARALAEAGTPLPVHCTDLYPNHAMLAATAEGADGQVTFEPSPVDATAVPPDMRGLRTLFNAFHHLRPAQARAVLADAHRSRQPIAIFEVVDRRPLNLVGLPFIPLFVLGMVPLIRPFRWAWVPLTYALPLVPLLGLWDGFVSCLRVYQPDELRALTAGLDDFDWDIGRTPLPGPPVQATWLVGTPKP